MQDVLIIGGGLAGCAVAKELSAVGIPSHIIDSGDGIGGKVRTYGCKADTQCNNCGLCTVGALWGDVESDSKVKKSFGAELTDLSDIGNGFRARIRTGNEVEEEDFSAIVVATGFEEESKAEGAGYDAATPEFSRVFTGGGLEALLKERGTEALFPEAPESVAFVLCYGSRTLKERSSYCSQICCGYSTRTAKVIKNYYPETEVVVYYMDLQAVNPGNYADELSSKGIVLERCRPSDISFDGEFPVIAYEGHDGKTKRKFDYIFLCGGVHPDIPRNTALADITGLQVKKDGFLDYVREPENTGIYLAGCAKKPLTIVGTLADAKHTAQELIEAIGNPDGNTVGEVSAQ